MYDRDWEIMFHEPENGVGGFYYTISAGTSGEEYDSSLGLVNNTWDIFLYNEDSYDKDVTINVYKVWKVL